MLGNLCNYISQPMPNQPSEGETPLETPLAHLCKLLVFLLLFQDVRESMQLHITTYAKPTPPRVRHLLRHLLAPYVNYLSFYCCFRMLGNLCNYISQPMPNQPSEGETPLETPLSSLCKLLVFLLLFQDLRESMQLHITTYAKPILRG